MGVKRYREMIERVQRRLTLRICCAYRTASNDALMVMAGVIPLHLLAEERNVVFRNSGEREARSENRERKQETPPWKIEWDNSEKGRWTHRLIRNIGKWVGRKKGEINYFLFQCLSGHGCFFSYLNRIGKLDSLTYQDCRGNRIVGVTTKEMPNTQHLNVLDGNRKGKYCTGKWKGD